MGVLSNPRHERFAQLLAEGKTADAAYQDAGYRANRHNAAALAREQHISTRVAEFMERTAIKSELTVLDIVSEITADRSLARRIEQPGPAIQASMSIAKLLGFVTEKREITGAVDFRAWLIASNTDSS